MDGQGPSAPAAQELQPGESWGLAANYQGGPWQPPKRGFGVQGMTPACQAPISHFRLTYIRVCTSIGYGGVLPGQSCRTSVSRLAHSTDPYLLAQAYYNAAVAMFKSGDESAQSLKPIPIEFCSDIPRLPPGAWPARPVRVVQCFLPFLGRDQRDDQGGSVAVWTKTPVTTRNFFINAVCNFKAARRAARFEAAGCPASC